MSVITALANVVRREPAIIITVATAGLGLAASNGLHLNVQETREVYAAAATIGGFLVRSAVTPTSSQLGKITALEARVAKLEPIVDEVLPSEAPVIDGAVKAVEGAVAEAVAAETPAATVPVDPTDTFSHS